MVLGIRYTVQFVGEDYKNFRTELKRVSQEGTKLDSDEAKLSTTLALQYFANCTGKDVSELSSQLQNQNSLVDFTGWVKKVGREEDDENSVVRTYEIFFQYPLVRAKLKNSDDNTVFAIMIDILVRSLMQSICSVYEVKQVVVDAFHGTHMNTFAILFTEKGAEEPNGSSGKQSSVTSNNSSKSIGKPTFKMFVSLVEQNKQVVDRNNKLVDRNNKLVDTILDIINLKITGVKLKAEKN